MKATVQFLDLKIEHRCIIFALGPDEKCVTLQNRRDEFRVKRPQLSEY